MWIPPGTNLCFRNLLRTNERLYLHLPDIIQIRGSLRSCHGSERYPNHSHFQAIRNTSCSKSQFRHHMSARCPRSYHIRMYDHTVPNRVSFSSLDTLYCIVRTVPKFINCNMKLLKGPVIYITKFSQFIV